MSRFFSFRNWTWSSWKAVKAQVVATRAAVASPANKNDDDAVSVASSLSSHSDTDDFLSDRPSDEPLRAAFENGVIVKAINDSVLLEQAADSLRSALDLIDNARDKRGSWVDARDLLDRTAAALDDAGLALRGRTSQDQSLSSKQIPSRKRSKKCLSADLSASNKDEMLVRRLADDVVDRRRSVLGDVLVHHADGPWAKMEYGKGDGISFGGDDLWRVPDEDKDDRALVAWASQTGMAKKFARHLHKLLGGDDRCVLKSMRELTLQNVAKHKRVYFVCSTFGFGRPPREGEIFYSLLQIGAMRCEENVEDHSESEQEKPLGGTSVAIAALGSSNFQDFAKFGFGLAKELTALGVDMALNVTTIDAKNGKVKQREAFNAWADMIAEMEKERWKDWMPKPTKTPKAA